MTKGSRLASIDVLRAITMYLMVFVNDLPTVKGVPAWLEHAPARADAMGFSDIIFPGFLFIVGLSIPFAIRSRIAKGESQSEIFKHIVLRSLALVVMGVFHVNLEHYSAQALLPLPVWEIIITIAFFMIWLDYKDEKIRKWKSILQVCGVILLCLMAILYRGGQGDEIGWMRTRWWGILGLIGWAYFVCASVVLFSAGKLGTVITALIFFIAFNVAFTLGWLNFMAPVTHFGFFDLGNASNAALVMSGVLTAMIYSRRGYCFTATGTLFLIMGVALISVGLATRPLWGISKIRATPSWVVITAGISLLTFMILTYLVDRKDKGHWFGILKPAGTSTLTCYLLPYLHLAIFISLLGWRLPVYLRTGIPGILKSLLFALIIVLITGWLEKRKIRLRI